MAKVLGILFLAGGLVWLSSWVTKRPAFILSTISIEGNSAVDAGDIRSVVEGDMAGSYLYLFPRSNRFLFPRWKIPSDVMAVSKRIQSASLSVSGNTLTVSIVERQPSYVWCEGAPEDPDASSTSSASPAGDTSDCYFVDAHGLIFSSAPVFTGNPFFEFYGTPAPAATSTGGTLLSTSTPVGTYYMDEASFMNLDHFLTSLDTAGIKAHALLVNGDGTADLYLDQGDRLLINLLPDFSDELTTILTLKRETTLFSTSTALDYIDIRFGNKIYYKTAADAVY
jgi:hypothetical protein